MTLSRCVAAVVLGAAVALQAVPNSLPENAKVVGTAPSDPRPFLRLLDGGRAEMLPTGMADGWPTWVLGADGSLARVPDGGEAEGWVNPVSCDDLWLAPDLPAPVARPCLGVHVRGGTLRHVFPAVDLVVEKGGVEYRNRGMRTVPRAHQWLTFGAQLPSELRLFAGGASHDCAAALGAVVAALADDAPDALGVGSHCIHVPIAGAAPLAAPEPGVALSLALADALFDAGDAAEVDKAGLLDVAVLESASGADSEYLPDVYRALYKAD